jgi:dye decolorizing peroxidase
LAFTDNNQGISRRSWNYDDGYLTDGTHDAGLIFTAFQADLERYLKIQAILAEMDALNAYTTPVGSALFVIPPGVAEGEWIGQDLLEP